jgi:hypothetical protein
VWLEVDGQWIKTSASADAAGATCGGASFTADTEVLLASGAVVPISQLKPGEKVLATNTVTGKTQAATISAVLVHHDVDLYDLKIKAGPRSAIIDTTSSHLFWIRGGAGDGRWAKAASLKYGTHLRTPSGGTAVVIGGYTPIQATGWMWDLTIRDDHDFYIETVAAATLVHNCDIPYGPATEKVQTVADQVESKGAPLQGYKGGRVFQNSDNALPGADSEGNAIAYKEWDVNPNIQGVDRGL